MAAAAEVHHDRAPVVRDDPEVPEEGEQVGVVAVAEERLGMCRYQLGIQVFQELDLIIAADGGDDGLDGGVRKGGVDIPCPFL